ncbi:MAG: 4Fe-4S binding protein [Candidatus Heimdallarchaeota archaeon]
MAKTESAAKHHSSATVYENSKKGFSLIIDAHRCKGCGLCVLVCPELALDFPKDAAISLRGNRVPTAYPERCIRCMKCERLCPDFAIFIRK